LICSILVEVRHLDCGQGLADCWKSTEVHALVE
jgi:hypothetical protein